MIIWDFNANFDHFINSFHIFEKTTQSKAKQKSEIEALFSTVSFHYIKSEQLNSYHSTLSNNNRELKQKEDENDGKKVKSFKWWGDERLIIQRRSGDITIYSYPQFIHLLPANFAIHFNPSSFISTPFSPSSSLISSPSKPLNINDIVNDDNEEDEDEYDSDEYYAENDDENEDINNNNNGKEDINKEFEKEVEKIIKLNKSNSNNNQQNSLHHLKYFYIFDLDNDDENSNKINENDEEINLENEENEIDIFAQTINFLNNDLDRSPPPLPSLNLEKPKQKNIQNNNDKNNNEKIRKLKKKVRIFEEVNPHHFIINKIKQNQIEEAKLIAKYYHIHYDFIYQIRWLINTLYPSSLNRSIDISNSDSISYSSYINRDKDIEEMNEMFNELSKIENRNWVLQQCYEYKGFHTYQSTHRFLTFALSLTLPSWLIPKNHSNDHFNNKNDNNNNNYNDDDGSEEDDNDDSDEEIIVIKKKEEERKDLFVLSFNDLKMIEKESGKSLKDDQANYSLYYRYLFIELIDRLEAYQYSISLFSPSFNYLQLPPFSTSSFTFVLYFFVFIIIYFNYFNL